MGDPSPRYVFGHDERELRRLATQARVVDPVTERFFRAAGIEAGLRVLDVGCGAGDVTFLVAEIVGEAGEVIGVDRSAAALARAETRVAERSLGNVAFREGDLAAVTFDQPFDAVVGRYVLQFQDDPAALLRRLASHVRPGGLFVFHEIDWSGVRSLPPVPTYDWCCTWLIETLRASGTERHMGVKLCAAFTEAGLGVPQMRLETLLGGGESATPLELVADLAATLLPTAMSLGIDVPADLDVGSLLGRMQDEARTTGSVVFGHFQVGAWATRR